MANKYVRSLAGGAGTGADWANAYTTLTAALAGSSAGDDLWVSEDHAESTAGAVTLTPPGTLASPVRIMCVDHLGTVPPVSADLRTTATVTTTGANNLLFGTGYAYWYGITFNCATGAVSADLGCAASGHWRHIFKSCKMVLVTTGAGARFYWGGAGLTQSHEVQFINTTVKFGHTSQYIGLVRGRFTWTDTASAIDTAVASPTTLFQSGPSPSSIIVNIDGVDFSALGSGKTIFGAFTALVDVTMRDCKVNSAATLITQQTIHGTRIRLFRATAAANNYMDEVHAYEGSQVVSTAVKRTSGASDGTTGFSWKITSTANSKWYAPFVCEQIRAWNATTGSAVTVTLEGVGDPRQFSALPKNDEFWFDVGYLGSATDGQGTFKTGTKADALATGSALTASTQAWDTGATARANSTAYAQGDVIKLASNSGRIFICTTAGTTAGSEPAGYATAVDGDSVTDNTATFKAAWRFKQTVTLSSPNPAQAGHLLIRPFIGKATAVVYLDPKITLA